MKQIIRKSLFYALLTFGVLSNLALAQDAPFRRVQLNGGISIEIPEHWIVLPQDTRKNLSAASAAMMSNAGLEASSSSKQRLLAVNATPYPTGAMVRVSVTSPPDYTQSDLATATSTDLEGLGAGLLSVFRHLEASGGPKIIAMQPVRIETFNGNRALVISYVRAGMDGLSSWQVTQYKIPNSSRLIELTLSHRKSDAIVWRPILERVKRSVRF